MKAGTVVIGANYGDEGKGLITDFEVRRTGAGAVSRFNGGAQAGHTVHDGDRSHVFGHVGAGTFAGAMTHLSSKFLVNPLLLIKELQHLKNKGVEPIVISDSRARVSTIYDMILNSMAELARGNDRHGSCGLGINETVTRHSAGFEITVADLSKSDLVQRIERIRSEWIPKRMNELLGSYVPSDVDARNQFSNMMSVLNMSSETHAINLQNAAKPLRIGTPSVPDGQHVVFEGAQGLALDEFMGAFPHVTRSMTGLPYALAAAADLGVKELQPVYVTRAYLTRHGAGPLFNEGLSFGGKNVIDTTNIPNEFQGELRFAPLDLRMLDNLIWEDIDRSKTMAQALGIKVLNPTIAVTCLDQMSEEVWFIDSNGGLRSMSHPSFLDRIETVTSLKISHVSHGPSAKDVRYIEPRT